MSNEPKSQTSCPFKIVSHDYGSQDCPLIALKTLTFVKLCYLSLSEKEAAPFSKEEELVLPVGVFSCFP